MLCLLHYPLLMYSRVAILAALQQYITTYQTTLRVLLHTLPSQSHISSSLHVPRSNKRGCKYIIVFLQYMRIQCLSRYVVVCVYACHSNFNIPTTCAFFVCFTPSKYLQDLATKNAYVQKLVCKCLEFEIAQVSFFLNLELHMRRF